MQSQGIIKNDNSDRFSYANHKKWIPKAGRLCGEWIVRIEESHVCRQAD